MTTMERDSHELFDREPHVAIVGAGIAGLVLALGLKKHLGITSVVYEQAPRFDDHVGGAIGLYANGLQVIRDISPNLLKLIQTHGFPYLLRRWMRHDGVEVAVANESELVEEPELQSIGIRRWKLQKILSDACAEQGILIHFGKRLRELEDDEHRMSSVQLDFEDGTSAEADLVLGADGLKSRVRASMFGETEVDYTGTTCLMGAAPIPRPMRGICLVSSATSKCHACYYPSGENETVFQIYFPAAEKPETWGPLSEVDAVKECADLETQLRKDGWHDDLLAPLKCAQSVIRVGLRAREPLLVWVKGRCALLGDAAHPPVPYIGQGAMMAIEDAGTLALLLKAHCLVHTKFGPRFQLDKLDTVFADYEELRLPRTRKILAASRELGQLQMKRTDGFFSSKKYEWYIWYLVKRYGSLPVLLEASRYTYSHEVHRRLCTKRRMNQMAKL